MKTMKFCRRIVGEEDGGVSGEWVFFSRKEFLGFMNICVDCKLFFIVKTVEINSIIIYYLTIL